ncbi:hypothetical protein [Tepidimicrobium xylanilyticum]|uniref:Uncharacterized protein n=1 Tax=Tepidimicrobium xylanilyticum TaxID=1123352 RepID=A0A1H2YD94_9FIRM|nr:hypothetical protein [Tepidimicrobium xylanilyticum]GMG97111.1 hypothetical protein EN5CB1_19370 [Tepidimicrobium xylanilyticum]SDX03136.1 hypothetical protein SAMN05660923_01592 [Tepidimicrobium xylanilyticum]
MSIRSVDYVNIVTKSQEVSKIRQVEHDKLRVQVEQGIVQQEKLRETKSKRVLNTNKSEGLRIDVDKRDQSRDNSSESNRKRKKRDNSGTDNNSQLGNKVDIKI